MTCETDTHFPRQEHTQFRVFFEHGKAVKIDVLSALPRKRRCSARSDPPLCADCDMGWKPAGSV